MKKHLPWILTAIMALWVLSGLRPARQKTEFNIAEFGRIPVLLNGRIQPMDSVARNSLLMLRGKQSVLLNPDRKWHERAEMLPPTEWLLTAMTRSEETDKQQIFRIDHPELLALLKLPPDEKYFSFNDVKPQMEELDKQATDIVTHEKRLNLDPQVRTPFQKAVMKLHFGVGVYGRLKNTLRPEGADDFAAEVALYKKSIGPGVEALKARETGKESDEQDLKLMVEFFKRYQVLNRLAYPLIVPPVTSDHSTTNWTTVGNSLMESMRSNEIHPAVEQFAAMATAFRQAKPADFNQALAKYNQWMQQNDFQKELGKGRKEFLFYQYEPFYKSSAIYLLAFILACASWINWSQWMNRSAYLLILLALAVHTSGLIVRMVLEGRPPVTNLYSSAIFVGWGAVVLGVILEKIYKDGIGSVTAGVIGFSTLIIAHNLALNGDTMEMLRAVLDTNFWLATHVVVITLGYSAMFIAGFLALVYIIRGFFTRSLSAPTSKALTRMVYGIICFATLFSFVGTILGGIWADQSWGRFWGWDPKENGALLIVIWCAVILHARWGGMIKERGLMAMAVFGNIITSFSWFGVNMLGVGLHSYGFMDQAFKWLTLFIISQLVFIGLAMMPVHYWKSLRSGAVSDKPEPKDAQAPNLVKPGTATART